MKKIAYIALLFATCVCCGVPDSFREIGCSPSIFPDYEGVTVPCNIAPLNFNILDSGARACAVRFDGRFTVKSKDGLIKIPPKVWRALMEQEDFSVECFSKRREGWVSFEPFSVKVSKDRIDPYIAYRLIPPGYEVWGEMGIYQRCLENYEESTIMDNSGTGTNCMNCHSFAGRDPQTFLFHMRAKNGGTYLIKNGSIEKLNTKTPETIAALVYPSWSVRGDYVAFSVNDISQFFHSRDRNMVEVYDTQSDVVVYDVKDHCINFSALTKSPDWFETFPTFSPDGKWLYFCRCKALDDMPWGYKDAKYNIVRIAFNPSDFAFGDTLETVYDAAADGKSATFPRISPDGRFLVVTRMDYGQFPIWHKEAQLFLVDLVTGDKKELYEFNSDDSDSYHGWSSNGRWMVFSSRRDDGLYTKPYIGHIDSEGRPSKAFLLPQENPYEFYIERMTSYNLPDFVLGEVNVTKEELTDVALNDKGIDISVKH